MRAGILSAALLALLVSGAAEAGLYPPRVQFLSHDNDSVCAASEGITQCWGGGGKIELPELKNPVSVSISYPHRCAVDDRGLQCWVIDKYGIFRKQWVPAVSNPKTVVAQRDINCVLDGSAVKCWGEGTQEPTWRMPSLQNARELTGEGGNFCVLESDRPVCWGHSGPQEYFFKQLGSPPVWSIGIYGICGVQPGGRVYCTGVWGSEPWSEQPRFSETKLVATGMQHACASDGETVGCWGKEHYVLQAAPGSRKVKSLVAGFGYTCLNDLDGIYCWTPTWNKDSTHTWPDGVRMENAHVPKAFRRLVLPSFHLYQLGNLLAWLESVTVPARSKFLHPLADFALKNLTTDERNDEISRTRYLLLKLASPALLTNDAPRFNSEILPAYRESVADIEAELGFSTTDRIGDSPLNREIALRVIAAALAVQEDFLPLSERAECQDLRRLTGQAIADPSAEQVRALLAAIDGAAVAMQKLEANSKSAFLVKAVRAATVWLKGSK